MASTLQGETGQSRDENREEANRLIRMILANDYPGFELNDWECDFIDNCADGRPVTNRMLFKLRSIRDKKYLGE